MAVLTECRSRWLRAPAAMLLCDQVRPSAPQRASASRLMLDEGALYRELSTGEPQVECVCFRSDRDRAMRLANLRLFLKRSATNVLQL